MGGSRRDETGFGEWLRRAALVAVALGILMWLLLGPVGQTVLRLFADWYFGLVAGR